MNIALLGYGRMGKKVWDIVQTENDTDVIFAIDNRLDIENAPVPVIQPGRFEETITHNKPDVIIDFSHPAATMQIAPTALKNDISMVTCTTGFTNDQQQNIKTLAADSQAAFLMAPNITPGINVLMLFAKIASRILPGYDIQILDYHHNKKHDRPSGTALKLADNLKKEGRDADVYGIRAGNIVGLHSVLLAGERDQIEISHQSYTRDIFAKSAIDAAKALAGRQGYLEMKDILNFDAIFQWCMRDA